MKIITIIGTRPEIIRLSEFMKLADQHQGINHITVHTGQNYDYELNKIFFDELGLREPDYYLGIDTSTLGKAYADVLIKCEEVFTDEKPDAIVILGDTNSSIAALIARRMKIPIYHLEAGNRSFDNNVPEEINRKVIDHISDFNIVYSDHSYRNLMNEGISQRFIFNFGSPLYEIFNKYSNTIQNRPSDLTGQIIASFHREENVDTKEKLKTIIESLQRVAKKFDKTVYVSLHPRTKKRIEQFGLVAGDRIKFLKPLGFIDYCSAQEKSFCVISDSGTISEESSILNFDAVTIRQSMERPEALDTGSIVITGLEADTIINAITIIKHTNRGQMPETYLSKDFSVRVLKLIIGTYNLRDKWRGIDR